MSPHRPRKRPPMAIQRAQRMLSRLELAIALEQAADGDADALDLAKLLRAQDPDTSRQTPHTLAQKIGIPFSRVIKLFQESKRMESVVAVAQRLPAIAEDIAIDAESKEVPCGSCAGEGKVKVGEQEKDCLPCGGTGKVLHPGDPVARKQVLEMMGLAGQHAMPIVAPGSNILITNSPDGLEATLKAAKGGGNGLHRNASRPEGNEQTIDSNS